MCPGGGMVDAADLKSASRKGVGVRVPSWAFHNENLKYTECLYYQINPKLNY